MSGIKNRKSLTYEESHKIVNNITYKRCNCHGDWFPNEDIWMPMNEEYFYKNKANLKDGFSPICKKCARSKINYNNKVDPTYRRRKSLERYYENKEQDTIRRKQWEIDNIEYKRERQLKYQRDNPERIKQYRVTRELHKSHSITEREWRDCKNYFLDENGENCCAYCGLPVSQHMVTYKGITKQGDFHKEHLDDKGANDLSNCVPSCKICNSKKHNKKFEEWYNKNNPIYDKRRYDKILKWIEEDYKQYYIIKKEKSN